MSGINDRQRVNALNSNAAWLAKNGDDATVGILSLENNAPASGAHVDNLQKAVNKAFEGVGATGESDTTINNYSSSNYVTNGDNRKVAIGKLDTQLKLTQDELDSVAILTTKGDILVHNGTTYVRQAIGANDQVLTADSSVASGVKWAAGGAGGGGVKNFVTNFGAESGTTGWTVDSFAAASRPSGALTGIATGITFAASSSSPLDGINSFTFAKDAANRQGRVVYTGLTFTPAYFAKVMNISIDMIVASGTFVAGTPTTDSDFIWYIQNVTDGTFIEPSNFKILSNSSTNSFQFTGTFQTAASATSYRLLGYVASTSAAAYTLRFDNVTVTPSAYAYGTPITDGVAYTPTIVGFGTPTSVSFTWQRVGDRAYIQGRFVSGTSTAVTGTVSLPSGLIIDSSISSNRTVGQLTYEATSGQIWNVRAVNPNGFFTFSGATGSLNGGTNALGNAIASAGIGVSFFASVKIQGFSSSVQTSDQTDTRIVVLEAQNSGATQSVTAAVTNINFLTTNKDSHGAWSGSVYTVPVAGDYLVSACAYSTATENQLVIYKNSAQYSYLIHAPANKASSGNSVLSNLKVGDTISIRSGNTGTIAADTSQKISISRISGPNQIAASESVNARYTNVAGTSITNSGDIVVPFATRDFDSHLSFVTDTYTIPVSGKYEVSATINFASSLYAVANTIYAVVYRNGTAHTYGPNNSTNAAFTGFVGASVTALVNCLAGDTIQIRTQNNRSAGATTLATNAGINSFYIERVGN